ncbi:MAG: CBS domain-containing protein, partial [Proteobacteria bacterium]|nr:CBS domain-containing protein [Pseudomonadota bacterium]
MSNTIEFLKKLHPFQDISQAELERVVAYLTTKSLQADEYLFQRGEAYHKTVYIVQQGKLEMHRQSGQVLELEVGDFIGLANFMDASPYLTSVKSLNEVKLLGLPATELQKFESLCPPLFEVFNRIIAKYIRDRGNTHRPITSHILCLPARSIMKAPLTTCGPTVTLLGAYELMLKRKIGSLGVTNQANKLLGLINFISIADAMLVQGAKSDTPVLEVACKKNNTVSPDTPMWKIEEIQQDQNLKYIIVVEDNKPIGIISQTDILNNLLTHQGLLFTEISTATSFAELAKFNQRIGEVASEARENNHRASVAVKNISEFHLALQRRCIELTLQTMEADGLGMPPTKYAFILMGSASRKEMLLNPDQDNAIILADDLKDADKQWFQTFCDRVNIHLDEIGYVLCPGNIMAKNNMFHKTLKQWEQQISHI